jgi:hypothetical protein
VTPTPLDYNISVVLYGRAVRMSTAALQASTNHHLLHDGETFALLGFVFGVTAFLITRRGRDGGPPDRTGFVSGRYLGLFYLRWPLLIMALVGLAIMVVAVA